MNNLIVTLVLVISFGLASSSMADSDFSKIRKDIKVMNKIIAGAIEADDECRGCRASVRGSYLADQGAIFVVTPGRSYFTKAIIADRDWGADHLDLQELEELEQLEGLETLHALPGVIGEIMSDVGVAISDINIDELTMDDHGTHKFFTSRHDRQSDEEKQTRSEMRALMREMRKIREELRDKELELLQAEESVREELELSVRDLEKNLRDLEDQNDELDAKLDKVYKIKKVERIKVRKAAEEKKQQQNTMLEHTVLATLCDYGGTLKNLPASERVSILFERDGKRWTEKKTRIYVLEKQDLQSCQQDDLDRDDLLAKAVKYNF